ncbi:branched-chain amino acid ABC transporter permease [Actinokineospora sp. PR83]|uniref:branched-chain amino acid ABC transporter permease n=1 Tax=Actinokineospora sp. PR83 TaxID=2884908 RepID=UPI001F3627B4|nr:branched-chain amino acid ABC transporter permease [Actinokineospora sp. PR83]MCG8918797.1 branched-chain amino acid ABC transporter permease [Actinokineospora sp. PR83]
MTILNRLPGSGALGRHLKPAHAKPLTAAGGVLAVVAALLPWVTFVLGDGAYPAKATLQFFDAPFAVEGYRLHVLLLGLVALVVTFVTRTPGRGRVLRALGWGVFAISLISAVFITGRGGGLGAITAADGVTAFGSVVGVVAGLLVVLGAKAGHLDDIPEWSTDLPRWAAYLALVVGFVGVLYLVASLLTAGGTGGASNPYAGPIFLAFLGMAGGVLGALNGLGVVRWISVLSEKHRAFSIAVLLVCALALPLTSAGNEYWMTVATIIGVYAATAIGLNIVVGLAGLLDLGYVAFMGIGAFVAANLSGAAAAKVGIHLPFPVAALLAAVIAGVIGAIVGSPTLRVRGDYLAIVTLAFGEIFSKSSQNNIGGLTGGANAIPGIPDVEVAGTAFNEPISVLGADLPGGVLYYFMIVLIVGAVMAVFANLKNSRIGRAWIAIREDEDAARAMGIKTGKAKILAFLAGATLAGLAGAVLAHKLTTTSYESFRFLESVTLLAAVILGGMGTIPGAVLGASLLFVLPEKLREFNDYRLLFFGLALILIMRFRPQGLVPDRVRRAELAGETAGGKSIEEEEELVVEHEHGTPGPKGDRA